MKSRGGRKGAIFLLPTLTTEDAESISRTTRRARCPPEWITFDPSSFSREPAAVDFQTNTRAVPPARRVYCIIMGLPLTLQAGELAAVDVKARLEPYHLQ